jgi:uncharacterized protein YggU (UPF0235/DUF167 family)
VADWLRERENGIDLSVRLTPRAARDAISGIETSADGRSHLAVRVRAVPERGAANAALERLVADGLGLPRSRVAIVAGQTARLKTVRVEGTPATLRDRLQRLALPADE